MSSIKSLLVGLIIFGVNFSCYAQPKLGSWELPCLDQIDKQEARSKELTELAKADQDDRINFENLSDDEKIQATENDF